MKVETAKTGLILLLMAYTIETWPWVEQSFRNEEARQAAIEFRNGVKKSLEQAYQESKAAQKTDGMDEVRAYLKRSEDTRLGDIGAQLRQYGLKQVEDSPCKGGLEGCRGSLVSVPNRNGFVE